ncbi:MAG: histidine--tRNA ligase [Pseudomonas fluorescens]|nr:MAG: histidine--tRNA ligase [Pseudomonas fluorescens]
MAKIDPISGFPEYLPAQQLAFDDITGKIAHIYKSFGYVPLETAAVERIDTLVSKGVDSKEVYALRRLNAADGDDGSKELALRFDLTVPLARYVAQNYSSLVFPFRRYQVQPVWRGERPQYGRYRQFHQFDLDVIGDGALPIEADAEVIAAAHSALMAVLPTGAEFTMRVNNRKLLLGLVEGAGFSAGDEVYKAVKVIDDLEKVSAEEARSKLVAINGGAQVDELLATLKAGKVDGLTGLNATAAEGAEELKTVMTTVRALTGNAANIVIDMTIARGLDYYTGTVLETKLHAAPELGSICSGGRYDNLTASLADRNLPGVGLSIGISRLSAWLMQQPPYSTLGATTAKVIVTGPAAASLCQTLRAEGIPCELALGDKSAGQHFMNAQKRGIAYGIVAENIEKAVVRTFADRSQTELDTHALVPYLQTLLDL